MVLSARVILLILTVIDVVAGVILWFVPGARVAAGAIIVCGFASLIVLFSLHAAPDSRLEESDDIGQIDDQRRRELVRGTSLHLREMHYRYSVRTDPSDRRSFTAEVNSVTIGFVPVVITDNVTDLQGYGYVAFIYDGRRWRGPGLPCGGEQEDAIRHAAKCVSPLEGAEVDVT